MHPAIRCLLVSLDYILIRRAFGKISSFKILKSQKSMMWFSERYRLKKNSPGTENFGALHPLSVISFSVLTHPNSNKAIDLKYLEMPCQRAADYGRAHAERQTCISFGLGCILCVFKWTWAGKPSMSPSWEKSHPRSRWHLWVWKLGWSNKNAPIAGKAPAMIVESAMKHNPGFNSFRRTETIKKNIDSEGDLSSF